MSPFAWRKADPDEWFDTTVSIADLVDGSMLSVEDEGDCFMLSWCPPGELGKFEPAYANGFAVETRSLEEAQRAAETWYLRGRIPCEWPLGEWIAPNDPSDA